MIVTINTPNISITSILLLLVFSIAYTLQPIPPLPQPFDNTLRRSDTPAIITYKAIDLVNKFRLDIMAKYIYAKHREMNVKSDWGLRVYSEHLHVWNNYYEASNPAKNSLSAYLRAFHKTLDSVKAQGFSATTSLVPLGLRSIDDGAHRVTACLLYNKDVLCKQTDNPGHDASSHFFRNKRDYVPTGLAEKYLDAMALTYCELKENTAIVVIFPRAIKDNQRIKKILQNYMHSIYEKEITLKASGPRNFIRNYLEASSKVNQCFTQNRTHSWTIHVFLVEILNQSLMQKAKQEINDALGISQAVHVTDGHDDTLKLARAVFNQNSIHFLNNANSKDFKNFNDFFTIYKNWLDRNSFDKECFCITGDAVLAAYGIRDCQQLGFIHHGYNNQCSIEISSITDNNSDAYYRTMSKDNILFNPENYFYYRDIKCAALHVVRNMKARQTNFRYFQPYGDPQEG